MTELVRFGLEEGGSVSFEIDEPPSMAHAGRGATIVKDAGESFERALVEVRNAASAALGQFRAMAERPDEVEIKFGVKVDVQAGAIIAKTGLQGQFEVKLKWIREKSSPSRAAPVQDLSGPP